MVTKYGQIDILLELEEKKRWKKTNLFFTLNVLSTNKFSFKKNKKNSNAVFLKAICLAGEKGCKNISVTRNVPIYQHQPNLIFLFLPLKINYKQKIVLNKQHFAHTKDNFAENGSPSCPLLETLFTCCHGLA